MDIAQIETIRGMAQEVCQREACELYDLEFIGRGKGRILRVYIDVAEESQSVSVDQCANVSRGLSLLLDVDDVVPDGAYELEVSSPGLERILREKWHFEAVVGKTIKVRTNAAITWPEALTPKSKKAKPLKSLTGELQQVKEDGLHLRAREEDWVIPMDIIHKANVVFEFNDLNKKRG